MDHERLQQAIVSIEAQRKPEYYGTPAAKLAELPATPRRPLIGGEMLHSTREAVQPIAAAIILESNNGVGKKDASVLTEQWDDSDFEGLEIEPIFFDKPDLYFEAIPPSIDPLAIKKDVHDNESAPPREDGSSRPLDITSMPFENVGSIRTVSNIVHPISPSDAGKTFIATLRSIARHEEAVPIGVVSFETDLDVETVDSLTDNVPGVKKHMDHNGEVWVEMPEVRAYAIKATANIDFGSLGFNTDELKNLETHLKTLRFIPNDQALLPPESEFFAAD